MEELDAEVRRRGLRLSLFTGIPMDVLGFNMEETLMGVEEGASNYPDLLQCSIIYEAARDAGYGMMKMPPIGILDVDAEEWVEMVADMVEEYLKKGYMAAVIAVEPLPQPRVLAKQAQGKAEGKRCLTYRR